MRSYEEYRKKLNGMDRETLKKLLYDKEKNLTDALKKAEIWELRYKTYSEDQKMLNDCISGRKESEHEERIAKLTGEIERLHREKSDLQKKNRELEEEYGRMQERLQDLEENEGRLMEISLCYRRKADEARGRAKAYRKAFEFAESTKGSLADTLICQVFHDLMPDGTIEECESDDDESCDEEKELHFAKSRGSRE